MIIVKCDRCGEEKQVSGLFPFPTGKDSGLGRFTISDNQSEYCKLINLCEECENSFERWLNAYNKDDSIS